MQFLIGFQSKYLICFCRWVVAIVQPVSTWNVNVVSWYLHCYSPFFRETVGIHLLLWIGIGINTVNHAFYNFLKWFHVANPKFQMICPPSLSTLCRNSLKKSNGDYHLVRVIFSSEISMMHVEVLMLMAPSDLFSPLLLLAYPLHIFLCICGGNKTAWNLLSVPTSHESKPSNWTSISDFIGIHTWYQLGWYLSLGQTCKSYYWIAFVLGVDQC